MMQAKSGKVSADEALQMKLCEKQKSDVTEKKGKVSCYQLVVSFLLFYQESVTSILGQSIQGLNDPTGTETFAKGPKLAIHCGS